MLYCRCDTGLLIGRRGFRGARLRGLVFGVIHPLPLSLLRRLLPYACLIWAHGRLHTLIRVPVYPSFLSLRASPPSQSPAPRVHLLSKASRVFINLSLCLFVSLPLREGGEQVSALPLQTHIHKNQNLILSPSFIYRYERCKIWREESVFSPRDLRTNRDRLARDTLPQDLSIHAERRLGDVLLLAL